MPIPRRISQNALQAIQPVGLRPDVSGAYVLSDELIGEDEEEFSHVGALPSLMPARSSPALRLVEPTRASSPGNAPPSYRSMEMQAVRPEPQPPPAATMSWDDEDDVAPMKLDLQVMPTTHTSGLHKAAAFAPQAQHQQQAQLQAQQPIAFERLSGTFIAAPTPSTDPNLDPTPGIVAFAGYGIAPEQLSKMPGYALRVMARRSTLRADLKIARMRRLPQREIDLYEAAIRCADEGVVTKGIAVVVSSIVGLVGAVAAVAATVL